MEKVDFNRNLVLFIKVNGNIIFLMDRVHKYFQIKISIEDNLLMDLKKDMADFSGMMVKYMRVSFIKVKLMEMVN